jgi:hypothetical protein
MFFLRWSRVQFPQPFLGGEGGLGVRSSLDVSALALAALALFAIGRCFGLCRTAAPRRPLRRDDDEEAGGLPASMTEGKLRSRGRAAAESCAEG